MELLPAAFYALKSYKQFIIYQTLPSASRPGKMDKLPVNMATGLTHNAHDPAIWMTAGEAIETVKFYGGKYGVGFVFTENDPFWFLDIDDCLQDSQWSALAKDLLTRLQGAAVEVSQSGRGLHIIGSGALPPHGCRNPDLHIELYDKGRFAALTGNHASGDASHTSPAIHLIVAQYFPSTNAPAATGGIQAQWDALVATGVSPAWRGSVDDDELIARMLTSTSARSLISGSATFRDLWDANVDVLTINYPGTKRAYDASAADLALAQHLCFWTGNDAERIKRLMLRSGLARDKYNRTDYLQRTIITACARQSDWLTDKPADINSEAPAGQPLITIKQGSSFLSVQDQVERFKGCTYIADENKILVPSGELYKAEVFRAMYGGCTMILDQANSKTSKNAWEVFTESPSLNTSKVATTCFRPDLPTGHIISHEGQSQVNVYCPVPTLCEPGNIAMFLDHIDKLCPVRRDATILISYMAACVQYMGVKFRWCPLLQGVEGNGKTLLMTCVAFAVGDRYVHYPKAAEIASRFNDWIYRKVFIAVEDIFITEGRMEVYEALKPMITSNRQEIEPKGGAKLTRDICANFMINTNHKDGLRKTKNDRRICPIYTAQQSPEDLIRDGMSGEYFQNIFKWLHSGGFAHVNFFLRNYPIPDEFNPATSCQRAPITSSTEEAIAGSHGRIEQEIYEAIGESLQGFRNGWISSTMFTRLLERLGLDRRIPPNKRHEILFGMGYIRHPMLTDGRTNCPVMPDGNKPRLYLISNHLALSLTDPVEIAKRYEDDQK